MFFTAPSMNTHVAHAGSPKSSYLCGSAKVCCMYWLHVLPCTVPREQRHPSPQLLLSQCLWMCLSGDTCAFTKTKQKLSSRPKKIIFICGCNSNYN